MDLLRAEHVTPLWNNVVQPIPGTTIRLVSGRALNIYRAKYVSDFHASYFAFRATCTSHPLFFTLRSFLPLLRLFVRPVAPLSPVKRGSLCVRLDKFKLNFRSPFLRKNHPIFMFETASWPFILFLSMWFVWSIVLWTVFFLFLFVFEIWRR